ncbi:TrbG/VirB9 family P-type conjugative transfer protein [Rhizobium sp. NFACC06-2]|uniref:TrbG/VirB9 family P-type conjugative transfer protein n=1 Tax=Rhizobium sp. NFACC06-2 TaxID=1566264 RepID=UPI000875FD04|nr:TrbG/VirB9 family P-type conjugative transfer protein [Rhizobium sp. NFACC06-2]SCY90330.1 type IV secretion system protein VirB9 [Rhizobium sp. NFACC06-2]
MLKKTTSILLACTVVVPALAAEEVPAPAAATSHSPADASPKPPPTSTAVDPRIRTYAYDEKKVYRLDLHLKSVTALQFANGEEVQSILIGDSSSWEVVKLKSGNVVSIKPIIPAATTNMTIYTDKRVYSFDLRSNGTAASGNEGVTLFRTMFTYADEKKPKPVQSEANIDPVNTDYLVSGKAKFRPGWVQDNGRQTTFFLPPGAQRPAIFKVGADKKEELVNSRTRGNLVIVDGTSDFWVMRIGDQFVCVGAKSAVKQKAGFMGRLEIVDAR